MVTAMIPLSEAEHETLRITAERAGKSQEELLREGVQMVLARYGAGDWKAAIKQAQGMWKDRDDLPSREELREEWNRYS